MDGVTVLFDTSQAEALREAAAGHAIETIDVARSDLGDYLDRPELFRLEDALSGARRVVQAIEAAMLLPHPGELAEVC